MDQPTQMQKWWEKHNLLVFPMFVEIHPMVVRWPPRRWWWWSIHIVEDLSELNVHIPIVVVTCWEELFIGIDHSVPLGVSPIFIFEVWKLVKDWLVSLNKDSIVFDRFFQGKKICSLVIGSLINPKHVEYKVWWFWTTSFGNAYKINYNK